jgi:hypothetical protein
MEKDLIKINYRTETVGVTLPYFGQVVNIQIPI